MKTLPRIAGWSINREELAWAAGFCDGEGSFHSSKPTRGRKRPEIKLSFTQVHPEVLLRFKKALGFGTPVGGPYDTSKYGNENAQPAYYYRIHGFENVQATLALLWTWLGTVKRAQAKHILKGMREFYGITR